MEGAATQCIPEYSAVLQATDGGTWWYAVVSGRLPDPAFLLSLDRSRHAICLVATADVAHEAGIQYP